MAKLKTQISFKILLAAAVLMSGHCARAVDSPAVHPSIGKDLPRVDPQHYWFSNRRSWLAIFPNDASTLRLYYSYLSGGWDNAQWINIRFLRDGKAVETSVRPLLRHSRFRTKHPGRTGRVSYYRASGTR